MSKNPLRDQQQEDARFRRLTAEVESTATEIAEILRKRAMTIAVSEQESVGLMAASVVSAIQMIDGGGFRRPGVTSAALDALLKWQTDAMRRFAQRNKVDFVIRPGHGPGEVAALILDAARGDSGDMRDSRGTLSPVSPEPPIEITQETVPEPTGDSVILDSYVSPHVPRPAEDQPGDDPWVVDSGILMRRSELENMLFGDPRYEPGSGGLEPLRPITPEGAARRAALVAEHRRQWPAMKAHAFKIDAGGAIGDCVCGRPMSHWLHEERRG